MNNKLLVGIVKKQKIVDYFHIEKTIIIIKKKDVKIVIKRIIEKEEIIKI